MSYYITGDCHADFKKVDIFCRNYKTSKSDVMIVLGDAGLNYSLDIKDDIRKNTVNAHHITCFMVHGNHEERPYNIDTYKEMEWHGGIVYYEEKYPNLLFAKDGEIYDFDGKKAIVIGGAYSVDKEFRLQCGYSWFESEQPTPEIKAYVEAQLEKVNWKVDYVFSHTCPLIYEPTDLFLSGIDQSKVDKSTEQWLSALNEKLSYETWYFGHYHENRTYLKSEMLFEGIKELGKEEFLQKVGRPKYRRTEMVLFYFDNGEELIEKYGRIQVVDPYGTFGQKKEVSYDIHSPEDDVLYKHIPESLICGQNDLKDVYKD